jgi:simple sugar transport system permease protein
MSQILSLLQAAIVFGTVILFGATGEILTEKSGNLNLGVPGVMYLGGIAGLAGAVWYEAGCQRPFRWSGSSLLVFALCGFRVCRLITAFYHHAARKPERHGLP